MMNLNFQSLDSHVEAITTDRLKMKYFVTVCN